MTPGKKIVGRKRHIAVSDSAGAQAILDTIRKRWPWLKHLFADAAHDRLQLMDKANLPTCRVAGSSNELSVG
jgi:hypothetical protein